MHRYQVTQVSAEGGTHGWQDEAAEDSPRLWIVSRKGNSPLGNFDPFSQSEFSSHSNLLCSWKGSQYFLSMLPQPDI